MLFAHLIPGDLIVLRDWDYNEFSLILSIQYSVECVHFTKLCQSNWMRVDDSLAIKHSETQLTSEIDKRIYSVFRKSKRLV